mmetsp:Transcript_72017/g.217845  ORF Transcript_72017/g.217845 Transcript_72017/m.217845 type:complete len:209 (+) Transcript_72017:123-749(+)
MPNGTEPGKSQQLRCTAHNVLRGAWPSSVSLLSFALRPLLVLPAHLIEGGRVVLGRALLAGVIIGHLGVRVRADLRLEAAELAAAGEADVVGLEGVLAPEALDRGPRGAGRCGQAQHQAQHQAHAQAPAPRALFRAHGLLRCCRKPCRALCSGCRRRLRRPSCPLRRSAECGCATEGGDEEVPRSGSEHNGADGHLLGLCGDGKVKRE